MESFRRILSSIHPAMLEELGLYETINWLIETFKKNTKISVRFQSNMQGQSMDFEKSLALYRTVQESLTNIMRYAKASVVIVQLQKTPEGIYLSIEDNGCGFEADKVDTKTHLGLLGMRERAYAINARFNLESIMGKGTRIEIKLESGYLIAKM
jgi:signal transduction histidine kinase